MFQIFSDCSRFWVCNPDLSDCLHECARANTPEGTLFFDISIKYPYGPVCNFPELVDCENKENMCKQCKPEEQCILCDDCPDCPEPCLDGGIKCVCNEGQTCINNNSRNILLYFTFVLIDIFTLKVGFTFFF